VTLSWTPQDLARFAATLQRLEQELLEEGDVEIDPNRQDEFAMGDDEDEQPLNEMNQAIASRRNQARVALLGQLRQASRRLLTAPDDFGYCLDCDSPIERARLDAVPYATLCVECQSVQEGPLRGRRRKITDYR
jgi:DnaK suppressor protein